MLADCAYPEASRILSSSNQSPPLSVISAEPRTSYSRASLEDFDFLQNGGAVPAWRSRLSVDIVFVCNKLVVYFLQGLRHDTTYA
jgi:hypothetical protein